MSEILVSRQNLDFMLFDVYGIEDLTGYSRYMDFNREAFGLILDTSFGIAENLMYPVLREMDSNPPEYDNGKVIVNPVVRKYMKECGDGGWISAPFDSEFGGQQLPQMIYTAHGLICSAYNYSLSVYPGLSTGAAGLIVAFASKKLQDYYLPHMFSGEWQGTMALTEPSAGSSLADITTKAYPDDAGFYHLKGQKIFISCGTHNGVDNIVHLMLAKIDGAPDGVRGISLFVVPEKRSDGNGGLEQNDVFCAGIDHKMGYRGSPIAQLMVGENNDCHGWLIGEEHHGLQYMFRMMNEERINVGIAAAGIASAAYYESLRYTKERPQGRKITEKNFSSAQDPIIEHMDVKRMLLFQRSVVEGSIGLAFYVSRLLDLARVTEGDEKEKFELLADFLVPIVKSYPSEMSILSTSTALQCMGGYGYCTDFDVELHFRDTRIHPIHEGTTGIQGQDILGRKATMKKGKALALFEGEMISTIREAKQYTGLKTYAEKLGEVVETMMQVNSHLVKYALKGKLEYFLADATLYLEYTGIIAIGWQWLVQAIAAEQKIEDILSDEEKNFYRGKIHTFKFFYKYELSKTTSLAEVLMDENQLTSDMDTALFS